MLLVIYAYGTGVGIRSVAAGEHPYSEDDLRYARRRFLSVAGACEVARVIASATFAARQTWLWGEGTTTVASDSTHFPPSIRTSSRSGTRGTKGPNEAF
jgi:TnpA family transposase